MKNILVIRTAHYGGSYSQICAGRSPWVIYVKIAPSDALLVRAYRVPGVDGIPFSGLETCGPMTFGYLT